MPSPNWLLAGESKHSIPKTHWVVFWKLLQAGQKVVTVLSLSYWPERETNILQPLKMQTIKYGSKRTIEGYALNLKTLEKAFLIN